ncbi:hypothetical protein niasHT_032646 [Heterodera trifolii]|uniref:Uncharacterized protein n=1 Tax=Heterodera trifolii TaxID=157864 RepID=A0ABD2IPI9_9BILA
MNQESQKKIRHKNERAPFFNQQKYHLFRLLVVLLCFCSGEQGWLSLFKDVKDLVDTLAGPLIDMSERKTRSACHKGTNCKCGFGACVQVDGALADFCCVDGFSHQCCYTTTTTTPTTPLPAELGFQQRCQYEESKCPCGWGACIKRQAWIGGGCCGKGFEFRCCESESIVSWERARTTDLVEYMKAKEECADVSAMCMCGFSRADDMIMGMCCDDGSCLCCQKEPELFKLPEVLREHYDTEACISNLPCKRDTPSHGCLETLSCTNYCVWSEGYKESECCRENYTLSCWTWKLILSSEQCNEYYQIAMSTKLMNDFNEVEEFCASHSYKVSSKFLKTIEANAKGEVIESSAFHLIYHAISIFGCILFWAYAVMW